MKKEILIGAGVALLVFILIMTVPCKKAKLTEEQISQLQQRLETSDFAFTKTSLSAPDKKLLCKRPVAFGLASKKQAELKIKTVEKADLCFYGNQDNWVKTKKHSGINEVIVNIPRKAKPCIYQYKAQFYIDGAEHGRAKDLYVVVK
ncbi:MAG: hypothetical protein MAG795_00773 [Candidatus Woesearchaeota archaeon]|nr:hypothetical protein [Candidatus Woesearchaeota archaeon]